MKKTVILLLGFTLLMPNLTRSQNNSEAAGAIVGGLLSIGAGIASIELYKEQLELGAVQYALNNFPDLVDFQLKTNSLGGTKLKDMSSVSIITFELENLSNNQRFIMFAFTSNGWMNDFGVNFSLIRWRRFDVSEWNKLMKAYIETASKSTISLEDVAASKIVNKGVKKDKDWVVEFEKLKGDIYFTNNYSDEFKIVFNEKSLGLYLKETEDLVQISRSALIRAHEFLNKQD